MNLNRTANMKMRTAFVLAFLAFSFVIFVLIANDWAVDINDLQGAVKKALGTRTVAEQQESLLAQLDVTPAEVFKQKLKNGTVVTVVIGNIQNNSRYPMEKIMVEGRLLDGTKMIRATTAPVPCGRTAPKTAISGMGPKQLKDFYMDGPQSFNCVIKSGFPAPFMVVFNTLPSNFNSTFKFEVHPHSGQFIE